MGRTSKQDDSLSSLSLEDIKKREVECNDDFHNLMYELSQLVERVRQIFGYSRVKFAQLLGLSVFQYYRFIDPTPDNCNPYVLAIYRFCYIFGYDLQSLHKHSRKTAEATDNALLEFAANLGNVPDTDLEHIIDVIKESDDMYYSIKNQVVASITTYMQERKKVANAFDERIKDMERTTPEAIIADTDDAADCDTVIIDEAKLQ